LFTIHVATFSYCRFFNDVKTVVKISTANGMTIRMDSEISMENFGWVSYGTYRVRQKSNPQYFFAVFSAIAWNFKAKFYRHI